MADNSILVRASIRLLSSTEGGRLVPVRGSYRPNHNFFGPGAREPAVGFIDLPWWKTLRPGQSVELRIRFSGVPGLAEQIYPGREWRIQEGDQLVGVGTVLRVLQG
jgi:elongation factor Tu